MFAMSGVVGGQCVQIVQLSAITCARGHGEQNAPPHWSDTPRSPSPAVAGVSAQLLA